MPFSSLSVSQPIINHLVDFCGEIGDNALILLDCDVFQGKFHKFRLIREKSIQSLTSKGHLSQL